MKNKFNIGLLSTINQPLLPLFLSFLIKENFKNIVVICDNKKNNLIKNNRIWLERTGGKLGKYKDIDTSVYKINYPKISFFSVDDHNSDKTIQLVNTLSLDILLNVGSPRKMKKNLINSVLHGIINVHPGLLPQYRGCCAVEWAIYNNEKVGNTAHFINEEYDSGNIILSEWYKFPVDSDHKFIRSKVYYKGAILAAKTLRHIFKNKIKPNDGIPQDNKISKYWNVIPDNKFSKVTKRLKDGKYKYQIL